MGIFDRMGKVISSNVNALLDKADDPRKSLNFIVDEMKDHIRAAKKELIEAVGAEKVLKKKVDEFDAEVIKWERRAELALKTGDEALAREALVQKKRIVAERDRAEASRGEQRAAALNMKTEIERMEIKQKDLDARKSTVATQIKQARAGGGAEGLGAKAGTGGGAFADFKRLEDEIDNKSAEVQAHQEVEQALRPGGISADELEAKFAALESGSGTSGSKGDPAIDDELAALKRRIRIG